MPALMVMGTASGVGKTLLVAGLCRAFARRGVAVAPFKPQNMSNNAAVTACGEIGRAQALQARAAGVAPSVHMNPVLLKPQTDTGAQVIVRGRLAGTADARAYQDMRPQLLQTILESFHHVCARAGLVIVEGAGSPAEVNLRRGDIANMGFARAAGVPAVLAGDVDRGGVIAALAGTVALLEAEDRRLLRGFIVNRFRGDRSLFAPALRIIEQRTGLDCLGVVPFFQGAALLPAEDAADLSARPASGSGGVVIAVPMLPRIANFDDLDPLRAEAGVEVCFIPPGRALPHAQAVILPGSKAVIADLDFMRRQKWDADVCAHVRRGGQVVGVCGGYQMLGRRICDPGGLEGPPEEAAGLGLLDVDTELLPRKTLARVRGADVGSGLPVAGYEIHAGRTGGSGAARPMLRLEGRDDGAVSADGRVRGCYLHGLFGADDFRRAFLAGLGTQDRTQARTPGLAPASGYEDALDAALDDLARMLEEALDLGRLLEIAEAG